MELHGTVFIALQKLAFFVTMAVLGLYEPFTHEITIVIWCVSGEGVAMLSLLWGRYYYIYMNGFYLYKKNSDKQHVRGLDKEVDEPSFFAAT